MTKDVELSADFLASRVARYFEHRYAGCSLTVITTGTMHDEQMMARALLDYRKAAKWPNPDVLDEVRCVHCHKIMGDESSAYEDEYVCRKCAPPLCWVPLS